MEQWKPIAGWSGRYEVSEAGRVRNVESGHVLAYSTTKTDGRRYVFLYDSPKRRRVQVSRLVLEAFVGPCPPGMEGCHNNGDKLNNHVSNLRWDTRSSNSLDAVKHGTHVSSHPRTRCPRGHEYTEDNTGYRLHADGRVQRYCRECGRARSRASRARRRDVKQTSRALDVVY